MILVFFPLSNPSKIFNSAIYPVKNQCFGLIVQTAFQRTKETTLIPLEGIVRVEEVTFPFSFMIKLGWVD